MASVSALAGFVVAAPGLFYLISTMDHRVTSGRRYATYDPELYVSGIAVTSGTAQLLTFGVAPLLISLSAYLVFRGEKNRRYNIASSGITD